MKKLLITLMLLIPVNVYAGDYYEPTNTKEAVELAKLPATITEFTSYYLTAAYAAQKTTSKCESLGVSIGTALMQEEESEEGIPFNLKYARDRLLAGFTPEVATFLNDRSFKNIDTMLLRVEQDINIRSPQSYVGWCRIVAPKLVAKLLLYYNESGRDAEGAAFKEFIALKDQYFKLMLDLEALGRN